MPDPHIDAALATSPASSDLQAADHPVRVAHADLLGSLLALTSDAVIAFDSSGVITLANDEAMRILAPLDAPPTGLVGQDVRLLLPPAVGVVPNAPFAPESLPFATDGATTRLVRTSADGQVRTLMVRCEYCEPPVDTYLLTAHPEQGSATESREHERLVDELSRANRRLSGTLDIVLGTLDSPSVGTLFERVLEMLCQTMDASGSAVYLSERRGFRLQATSKSLVEAAVPRFLPRKRSLVALAMEASHALRLRVLPPDKESLRQGRLAQRTVMDEATRETYRVRSSQLPPFTSFMAVPVRFGGRVIALITVGWRSARAIPADDANLLDAVTRYLSVQLVGAFSALRTQRRERLQERANDLRDKLVTMPLTEETAHTVATTVAEDLNCACALIDADTALDGHAVVHLATSHEEVAVPSELVRGEGAITPIGSDTPLGVWFAEQGEPSQGALVDVALVEGVRVCFAVLRPADAEPLDDLELDYLRQVSETLEALASGDEGRRQDHRISQALQQGMRSELQQVEGISAAGIYSSATRAAFVGGDFYDLIALPEHRACVIMGDVSGKGVEAASVSAAVRTALGAYSWEGLEPAHMVALLNEFLLGFSRLETFATLFVGIADLAVGTLAYCSAGHPPALLLRAQTGELEWLGVQSGVVGAFHDMSYRDGHVELGVGDMLLLYTDGTTEARSSDGRFFGDDGLRDAVMSEGPEGFDGLLDRLLARLDDFTSNSLDDDVAMVALRFDGLDN